jgi:hypothetical protein
MLVALSTLFTKQHYAADVLAGILLGAAAYAVLLRGYPCATASDEGRRAAPALALVTAGLVAAVGGVPLVAYLSEATL